MAKSTSDIADIEYIFQLVYNFRLVELQTILEAVKQNKSGDEKYLRNQVLTLLSDPSSNTNKLKETIMHVFKSKSQQKQQSLQTQSHIVTVQPNLSLSNNQTYTSSRSNHIQPLVETPNSSIQFENLPFFKTIFHTVLKPIVYECRTNYANISEQFTLSNSLIDSILKSWNPVSQEYKIQIIIRFAQVGLQENVCERLPYNISVYVNYCDCKLPTLNIPKNDEIPQWRSNDPIDITQQTHLKYLIQNSLLITWSEEPLKYIAGFFVAEKLTWNDLLDELKKRPLRASDLTKEFIKKSMESDDDINIDSLIATLKDPLTNLRMELPARGKNCIHMPCFDAIQFLRMNEHKQSWTCPLCNNKIKYENIEVDEFFLNILQSPNLSEACENVILFKDGTWTEKKNKVFSYSSETNQCKSSNSIEVFTIDDNDVKSINDVDSATDEDEEILKWTEKKNKVFSNSSKTNQCQSSKTKEVFTINDNDVKSINDVDSDIDKETPKSKRIKHNAETENSIKTNVGNSTVIVTVSNLSLKNESATSTSGCSNDAPINILNDDIDIQSSTDIDKETPKSKRIKHNAETENPIKINVGNSTVIFTVSNMSLKNESATSTSGCSNDAPINILNDDIDIQSSTKPRCSLNNNYHSNITTPRANTKDCLESSTESSENNKNKKKDY